MKMPRTEVDSSRLSAWAFTRLRHKGYPQYLWNVSEVDCSRFSFSYTNDNKKYSINNI